VKVKKEQTRCEFCKKTLSKDKGELEHGCLDCHGYLYRRDDGSLYCEHCTPKKPPVKRGKKRSK
jgi:Zn finger protein HypA/HybF involved in hydrogenase expression